MSKENVMKFEERVAKERELQEKLEAAANAYEGDKSDERAVFEAVIAPVTKEAGLEFTFEEAAEVKKESMDGEIDLSDMKAVAGGAVGGFCIMVGGGKGEGGCFIGGCSKSECECLGSLDGTGIGVTNCDGLGFGIGFFGARK